MKTSNKLLLGGFFTVVLLISGIHIALYAKYKSGKYTIYHPEDRDGRATMESFPNVKYVTISKLYATTIRFSDKPGVAKSKSDKVDYVQKGDSLIITGKGGEGEMYSLNPIELIVPFNITLSAVDSRFSVEKGKENSDASPIIYLNNSHAIFNSSMHTIRFGNIKIIATEYSLAAFQGNMQVDNLEVKLINSALEYTEGDAGQLCIITDSISRVSLQSKQLLKAKITTLPNNP